MSDPQARAFVPAILRQFFDSESTVSGLRSPDLKRTGTRGSSSPDAGAVARVDKWQSAAHRRVRLALLSLSPEHVEILSLAYGVVFRSRDIDDQGKRKAVKTGERGWRVRLVELYGIGEPAIVLASPKAQRLYRQHVEALKQDAEDATPELEARVAGLDVDEDTPIRAFIPAVAQGALARVTKAQQGGLIAWLLDAGRKHAKEIQAEARALLAEACDAFATAYGLEAPKRTRNTERTRARILAHHAEHGQEIGG